MVNLIILLLATIIFFAAFTFARKFNDIAVLIAVAIGCCVNANIFTAVSHPITVWGMTFGIDSILYSMFLFTIIIRMFDYSIREGQVMTLTSIAAILISAVIEYVAIVSYKGTFEKIDLFNLIKYFASAVGTFISIWLIEKLYLAMSKKNLNKYFMFLILILNGGLINALFLYGVMGLINGFSGHSLSIFLGSLILRLFCVALCHTSYYIYEKFLKKV